MHNFFRQLFMPVISIVPTCESCILYFKFCFSSYTGMVIFMILTALRSIKLIGEGAYKRGGHLIEKGTNLRTDLCQR